VAVIPKEDLLALLYRDRDVSVRFIKMMTREVKEKEVQLLELAYASVRQRVAQALIRLRDRYSDAKSKDLGLRISREDLATIVGTATESLIRTLSDLRDEGMVDLQGRDIHIKDARKLEQLAHN
jgi:CRP-like cAMP-binding protein